ncbi:MAG TPA: hypothetical protein VGV14_09980, partial [Rhodanobacter sp.]|nr:hypothetical protein [Rhodanobacter sp.]
FRTDTSRNASTTCRAFSRCWTWQPVIRCGDDVRGDMAVQSTGGCILKGVTYVGFATFRLKTLTACERTEAQCADS